MKFSAGWASSASMRMWHLIKNSEKCGVQVLQEYKDSPGRGNKCSARGKERQGSQEASPHLLREVTVRCNIRGLAGCQVM